MIQRPRSDAPVSPTLAMTGLRHRPLLPGALTALGLACLLSLGGCGGGGPPATGTPNPGGPPGNPGPNTGGPPTQPFTPQLSFAERRQALTALEAEFASLTGGIRSPEAQLPSRGQALYDGHFAGRLGPSAVNADIALVASFETGMMTGRIDAFRRGDNTPITGHLDLTGAPLGAGDGRPFAGPVTGTLTTRQGAVAVDATAEGAFHGGSTRYVAGEMAGQGRSPAGSRAFSGRFLAK